MHQNHIPYAIALVTLLAIVGCMLPGQALPPAPVSQPVDLETAVAGTAQAAEQQTEQAMPVIPTETAVPTETPAPSEVISTYGTSLTKLADGSTQFRDHRAGVQITFPPQWLVLRANEPEYFAAWENEGAQNPVIMETISGIQNLDLNIFRITAFNLNPEEVLYQAFPRINIVFVERDARPLEQVAREEKQAIESSVRKGHTFISSSFAETSGGLPIMIFEADWQSSSFNSVEYTTYYRGVFFNTPAGLVVIDLFVPKEQRAVLSLECDQIAESVSFFTP